MASVPQRLGDLLLARRALSPDQLGTALAEQQRRPEPLGQILLRLGFVTENHLLEAFGHAVHDSATAIVFLNAISFFPTAPSSVSSSQPKIW